MFVAKLKKIMFKKELDELKKKNEEIEDILKADREVKENTIKILLLGCGEAGKSTFLKQMKILHADSETIWQPEQLDKYRDQIRMNLIQSIQILLSNKKRDLPIGFENNARKLEELDEKRDHDKLHQHRVFIKEIWQHQALQEAFRRRKDFHLPDSAAYFLENIDRISAQNYTPSNQDILNIRIMTTGIHKYEFNVKLKGFSKNIEMIDVGGQRSEQRKWIHVFDDVQLLIFLSASNEFDQKLKEDDSKNRLEESLDVFTKLMKHPWFKHRAIALFLNKKDLLEEKVKHAQLEDFFPGFRKFKKYKPYDYESAIAYIQHMFLSVQDEKGNPLIKKDRTVYTHCTCATDTDNINKVFEQVKSAILLTIISVVL